MKIFSDYSGFGEFTMSLYSRSVRVQVQKFFDGFFAQYVASANRPGNWEVHPSELDQPFFVYWNTVKNEHRSHCAECVDHSNCLIGDALSQLCPDPISGVSELFHVLMRPVLDFSGFCTIPPNPFQRSGL